jgi:oligoendopeptidase F
MPKLRSEINDSDKWAVNDIFENDAAWEASFEALRKKMDAVNVFQGKLNNAAAIAEFYKVSEDAELEMNKLYTYAHMKHDEDTANSVYRSMQDRIYSVCVEYDEQTAWVTPEIMAIDDKTMTDILDSAEIAPYKFSMEKLLRQKKYVLSEKE